MNSKTSDQIAMMSRERPATRGSGRWKTVTFAGLLLGGLIALFTIIFRDQLTPAIAVETDLLVLLEDSSVGSEFVTDRRDELLFQASGWLEPEPWPVKVATLTDGFVEDIFIKEGQSVTNGQLLARLDQRDATLALQAAEARVHAAAARATHAQDTWKRISGLPDRDTAPSERVAAKHNCLEKEALLSSAKSALDAAKLALERTEIRSPMTGIVLRRYADPGSKRGSAQDDPNSATIVSLYDPSRLQVRVDVPLAEAGKLAIGQPTRISTAMLPESTFTGHVTRIVGEADLQRNTLQAKVAVHKPDSRMRPEVLCRVEFLGDQGLRDASAGRNTSTRHSLWIPEQALGDPSRVKQEVWVVDPLSRKASQRAIELGTTRRGRFRHVLSGLRPNERVVISKRKALKPGIRVKVLKQEESR